MVFTVDAHRESQRGSVYTFYWVSYTFAHAPEINTLLEWSSSSWIGVELPLFRLRSRS